MRHERRWQWFFVMLVGAICVTIIVGTIILYRIPPPISYDRSIYKPRKAALCAGEWLEYDAVRKINTAPSVVMVVGSWWSLELQTTVIPMRVPEWYVYTQPNEAHSEIRVQVPHQLPPGEYEYRVAAQAVGSRASVHSVRVTVVPC